jgi:hypothetical protein
MYVCIIFFIGYWIQDMMIRIVLNKKRNFENYTGITSSFYAYISSINCKLNTVLSQLMDIDFLQLSTFAAAGCGSLAKLDVCILHIAIFSPNKAKNILHFLQVF